ncbi:hypothetical protein H0H92_013456 [Tricholoma furcatifolium]|nr:hypothetical protein H0H92_013456 [Tricholoma furcatifolium]
MRAHSNSPIVYTSGQSLMRDVSERQQLSRALIDHGSEVLKELLDLQDKGWRDESIEKHFVEQRKIADNASSDLSVIWFHRMKKVFCEIDQYSSCIPFSEPIEFLDLGCCPGGFSSSVLDKNPAAKGFGISLPVTEGGHEFALELKHHCRFDLTYANATYYQLGPSMIDDPCLLPIPDRISARSFDIAILDGHQLRTQTSALPWDHNRLLISQLILSLKAVKRGGTIMIKLSLPHKPFAAKILYMFKIISYKLCCWKPKSMHANRGTFYAVAKGVGKGQENSRIPVFLLAFQELWVSLTFGGEEGLGRFMTPEDLDFLITEDDLMSDHLDWLLNLGDPLWRCQADALRHLYQRRGIEL